MLEFEDADDLIFEGVRRNSLSCRGRAEGRREVVVELNLLVVELVKLNEVAGEVGVDEAVTVEVNELTEVVGDEADRNESLI